MLNTIRKPRDLNKVCKPSMGFTDALLEAFGDLRLTSTDRRVFLQQAAALYSRVRKKERFHRYLHQFFDDLIEQRSDTDKIGYYIKKLLKAKRLPRLEKYTDPSWRSANYIP
jgi:hypothetical protein